MKKRGISLLLAFAMLLCAAPIVSSGQTAQAAGSDDTALLRPVNRKTSVPSGYTAIRTARDLSAVREDTSGNYILMNDIDLSGMTWESIKGPSQAEAEFTGILDGNGYVVKNMNCVSDWSAALFSDNSGTIRNLAVTGTANIKNVDYFDSFAAGVCKSNSGTIENCTSAVTVTDTGSTLQSDLGGLVGTNFGTIEACRFTGTIRAGSGSDGIAGFSKLQAGGIACTSFGELIACETTGDLLLQSQDSTVKAGGVVGLGYGAMDQCRTTGTISVTGNCETTDLYLGGLVGDSQVESLTNSCFNGKIAIDLDVQEPEYSDTYLVGGLAGDAVALTTLENCYVSGAILDSSTTLGGTPGWCFGELYWEDGYSGIYYPAGSFDACQSQTPVNGGPDGFSPISLTAMASQGSFPEYDFGSVWTMNQSYPVQKVFTSLYHGDDTEEPIPPEPGGDVGEISDEEYIQQHLHFAKSSHYDERMDSRFARDLENALDSTASNAAEAAYNILNTASELSRFHTLSIFENPYDAILTEMILSASSANIQSMNTKLAAELLDAANGIWGLVKKVQPDWEPGTYKPAIQELLTAPEHLKQTDPTLYTKLAAALEDVMDEEGAHKTLQAISGTSNFFGKAGEVAGFLNSYTEACDWIIDCSNFSSTVKAYQSLSDEYVQTLRQVSDRMTWNNAQVYALRFDSALDEYDGWLTENCIAAAMLKHDLFGFAELTVNVLSPLTQTVMTSYLTEALGIGAGQAGAVVAAYNIGWSLSNLVTGNDKAVESRELIRANYYLEKSLYQVLRDDRERLVDEASMASAQKFDASYMLLRISEIYSLQAYKDYLEAQQKSFTHGILHLSNEFNNDEITIANFEVIGWDSSLCHGENIRQQMARSQLTIACPTDVTVTDSAGKKVLAIEDGDVTTYAGGVSAAESNGVKVITFADGQNYNVKITGTDSGSMTCIFTSFDQSGRAAMRTVYESLPVEWNRSYQAQITQTGTTAACQLKQGGTIQTPDRTDNGGQQTMVSRLTLDQNTLHLQPDDGTWLNASVFPSNATVQAVSWSSSKPEVAEVDEEGFVWANGAGTCTITASALDGSGVTQICTVTVSADLPFTDVPPGAWFYEAVSYVYREEIMNGVSDTIFQPNGKMSRAMVATVLYRLEGEPDASYHRVFTDVPDGQWYTDAIMWAYEKGIIGGYGNSRFGTQDNVTRQQLATMLYRYANVVDMDTSEWGSLSGFRDRNQVSDWAREAMEWAVGSGLIAGVTDTTLVPNGTATRAQCATILMRLLTD